MNRFLRFTALLISLATILLSPTKLYALSYTANFTDLGDHPGAVVQQTDVGRTINNLTLFNNKIYASYGDYGANTGPIQLIPYNISTNTYEPSEFTLATEATQIMRVFGGKLYVPVVDGDGCGSCTPTTAVYDGSTWSLIQVAGSTAEHLFDVATSDGNDLLFFGAGGNMARVWRTTDSGANWSIVSTNQIDPSSASERYYWGLNMGGIVYTQSWWAGQSSSVKEFNGTNWTNGSTDTICSDYLISPVVFQDSIIVCRANSSLTTFDGTTVNTVNKPSGCFDIIAHTVTEDDVYIMCRSGYSTTDPLVIYYTNNFTDWNTITNVPNTATSLLVLPTAGLPDIYVGTSDSKIYKTSLANDNPVASSDTSSTVANTPITLNLLQNDTEPNEQTLAIIEIDSQTITVGQTITLNDGSGTVTLNNDQTITFTPTTGYIGQSQFIYTVSDGDGGADNASVSINITTSTTNSPSQNNSNTSSSYTASNPSASSSSLAETGEGQGFYIVGFGVLIIITVAYNLWSKIFADI